MAETDLALRLTAHLQSQGFTCFFEVACDGQTADIVAVKPDPEAVDGKLIVMAVEVKDSLSVAVLLQAMAWRDWATHVAIATPPHRSDSIRRRHGAVELVKQLRLGWYVLSARTCTPILKAPELNAVARLTDYLHPEQQTFAAPSNAMSARFTPYQAWLRDVAAWVADHPGKKLSQIADAVPHPTLPAGAGLQALKLAAVKGRIRGVESRRSGGLWRCWPAAVSEDADRKASA